MTNFNELGLSRPLLQALAAKNYTKPTPIQQRAIPLVLAGRDLLGIAQTGTGKTAAFMLPALDRLAEARRAPAPRRARMLVLAPTRELASQIATSARAYAAQMAMSVGVIFGGVPNMKSVREVSRGLDVLVATPGRLLDLVDQRALDLSALEILVLDEADQMLDLGFIHALKRIVQLIPARRQTLFFSATMPKAIRQLADAYLTSPAEVAVAPVATTAERVEQRLVHVNKAEKPALLAMLLQAEPIERALVFSRTKHGADKIVRYLERAGIASSAIHGNKSQPQREKALAAFRSGQVPVLIATDIAARGIDIPGVSHVFNVDLPEVPDQYVHRIGRTARAGATGIAIAFCSDEERGLLRDIERLIRSPIAAMPLPPGLNAAIEAYGRMQASAGPRLREAGMPKPAAGLVSVRGERDRSGHRHPPRAEGHPAHRGRPAKRGPRRGGGRRSNVAAR